MTRIGLAILLLGALTLFAACGNDETRADQPPEIEYGRDTCSECGMIISDERYAGGIVDENGDALIFDDIGEMIFIIQDEGVNDRRIWVHDADSLEWIDGSKAHFAVSMHVVTPMGSGVTAFESLSDAEAFANEHEGQVMSWDEILTDWQWEMQR